ncbi:uncharacterized protein EI90DRAFT_1750188 [Cantharellus anzutake]|uniref:uncharacterized protein n=1 Tax=Cantharellus anzutake TaxID=1750568 RepID=UPI00190617BA|nr:uncharacterized protein EI90DRAFT_1750188 [Cantharellus anzutake]KAF8341538.1 hypothetical protein EI90DRAFT_1750188 [Cantharellus anzutake]
MRLTLICILTGPLWLTGRPKMGIWVHSLPLRQRYSQGKGRGARVEVCDAEMEGLVQGSEHLVPWLNNNFLKESDLTLSTFSDNTVILKILDERPLCRIEIKWVPGHKNTTGNDLADSLAKEDSTLEH